MRSTTYLAAAMALLASTGPAAANPAAAATPQLNETTWAFSTDDGTPMQETVDAAGNYVLTSGSQHIDHGTSVVKGDKFCFTSAMTKEGEVCWTAKPLAVGESMETVSDKGQVLTVQRVAYVPAAPKN
jgi:hypothetical protein